MKVDETKQTIHSIVVIAINYHIKKFLHAASTAGVYFMTFLMALLLWQHEEKNFRAQSLTHWNSAHSLTHWNSLIT